jgi:hypothetical protein
MELNSKSFRVSRFEIFHPHSRLAHENELVSTSQTAGFSLSPPQKGRHHLSTQFHHATSEQASPMEAHAHDNIIMLALPPFVKLSNVYSSMCM